MQGASGRPFTSAMEGYLRMAGMWLVGEDMPQATTASRSTRSQDTFGLPVASVHFDDHPDDIAMRITPRAGGGGLLGASARR